MNESPTTRYTLIQRLQLPCDNLAWQEFAEIYEPVVYRLARAKGFQDADAKDVCQEVMATVAHAIHKWQPDPSLGTFRGWLLRITRNLMVNFVAAKQFRLRGTGDSLFLRFLDQQPDSSQGPSTFDTEYRREVFQWAARQVRAGLQADTWDAFWLSSVEGWPIEQVAQRTGKSVGAVYAARSRVMAKLRVTVARYSDGADKI